MRRDAALRFQRLLAELETLDGSPAGNPEILTRRSEILQSILQLFASNAQDEHEGTQLPRI